MRRKKMCSRIFSGLSNAFIFIFIFFLLVAAWGNTKAYAQAPTLDGQLDSVYFSHGYSIDYDGFYPGANATLYVIDNTSIDANNIWVAWVISKDFNDNSYGNNRHSSWPSGHEFDDLLESDLQRLDLENSCGELVLDATMDYIDGPPYHAAYPTISGFDADMDSTESIKNYINGGDWTDMAYKTSLISNLNDFGYCTGVETCSCGGTDLMNDSPAWSDEPNYIPAASCSNWEYDLIWELRIDRTVFQTATCPSGTLLGVATNPVELHASPSKEQVSPVTLIKASSIIGDYVWLDVDRDGVQDVGEPGIPNVTLDLYTDPNGDGDPSDGSVIYTATTDAFGRYLFPNLGSGNYVVDVTDTNGKLTGYSLTTGSTDPHGPISLGRNDEYLDADFGYAPTDTTKAIIGDFVWSDADNDGIQDPGEPGIGGVTINLLADYDGDGNFTDVVTSTTTAADGSYLFTGVDPGDYKVDVTDTGGVLSGYTLTLGPHSSKDPSTQIHVDAGDAYLNADFGYYKSGLGTIGNQIWHDLDGDGVYEPGDGEPGFANVTVDLILDVDGDGVWDPGSPIISSMTAIDGSYLFTGLNLDDGGGDGDADYLVRVTDLNNVLRRYRKTTGPSPGSDNNSQANPYAVAISSASPNNTTADFGYWFDQAEGMVGDRVWYDLDGDGVQDTGEEGIAGVTVEIWIMKKTGGTWNPDQMIGEVVTDVNGNYYFPNLAVSNQGNRYQTRIVASNFASGGPLEGYTGTNQPDNWDESEILTTNGQKVDLTLDFGYYRSGTTYSIGDFVWYDADGDGVQDGGSEIGFENVTLALYEDTNGNGVIDDGEPLLATDTTDSNGNYLFSGLSNGDYLVKVTDENNILTGYQQTYGNHPWPVTISGASIDIIDFGYNRPSPTLAVISSFQAYSDGGPVVVHWETASEIGTAGFYLLRKDDSDGKYKQVNETFLPGLLHSPQGGIYRFVDNGAFYGETYTYKLVEIESEGGKRIHGPFTVIVGTRIPRIDDSRPLLEPMDGIYSKQPHGISSKRKTRLQARQLSLNTARVLKKSRIGDEAKIIVKEKGLYYLDAAVIAEVLGMSSGQVTQRIKNHHFLLTNQGQEVAYIPAEGDAGLYFYGDGINSLYTDENIYWLEKGKGLNMGSVYGGLPSPTSGNETFANTLHIEEDHYALTALYRDPETDYWLWDYITAGQVGKTFTFYAHGAAEGGSANITVHLKGATNAPVSPDQHAKVSLNGSLIGESEWNGTNDHTFTISISQSLLIDGENTIEVAGILNNGVPYSIFYVDSFDLSYHRHYRAVNNRLLCRGDQNPVITIDGFTDPNIMVFEVTDPLQPKLVTGTFIDTGSSYRVSFIPSSSESRYLALNAYGQHAPVSVFANKSSDLKKNQNSADYVVIAPEGLEDAVQGLTSLRERKGLETMVVELEDIYDEFNYGISNPHAIKAFLSYAYHNWRGNGPEYVVLAGEGTYDYKDNLGYEGNLVPPILMKTPHGLFASDNHFADVVGEDGVPEIAIGRLPVVTEEELQTLIDKISDYENASGVWTSRVMMLADDPDGGGNFPADSDILANLFPGYTIDKIYLPDYPTVDEARQEVLNGFNTGALLVNYIGHAGITKLATEGLLRTEDVSSLQNGDKLPVLTAMTCVVGRFALPGYDTLSEELLLKNNGGVVAVWAPTGASLNSLAFMLAEEFFKVAFQEQEKIIGKALVRAMANYASIGGQTYMLNIYTLLGDPALEIK